MTDHLVTRRSRASITARPKRRLGSTPIEGRPPARVKRPTMICGGSRGAPQHRLAIGGRRSSRSPPPAAGIVLASSSLCGRGAAAPGGPSGMVVTPAEAIRPIVGDSSDVYFGGPPRSTVWAAARGFVIGGTLAFVAALVAASVPPLRGFVVRLAAIANAAPWVAVAPCLLIVLGRDRARSRSPRSPCSSSMFVSTSVGLGAAPAATHDVATALGVGRFRRVWSVQLPGVVAVDRRRAEARRTRRPRRRRVRRVVRRRARARRAADHLDAGRAGRPAVGGRAAVRRCGLIAYGVCSRAAGTRRVAGTGARDRPAVGVPVPPPRTEPGCATLPTRSAAVARWCSSCSSGCGGRGSRSRTSRRSSCRARRPCSTISIAAPGDYLCGDAAHDVTAVDRARRSARCSVSPRRWPRHVPVRRRDDRPVSWSCCRPRRCSPCSRSSPGSRLQPEPPSGRSPRCSCSSRSSCSHGRVSTPPAGPVLDVVDALGGQSGVTVPVRRAAGRRPAHRQRVPHRRRVGRSSPPSSARA